MEHMSEDQREWIPVPPPHPYATQPTAQDRRGKALAITSMALGLAALVTVCVGVFFFSAIWFTLAALLGLAGIIVGIIALVRRSRPLGASITGVAAGALSGFGAVALLIVAAVVPIVQQAGSALEDSLESQPWQPGDAQESLIEWPANMATGGIIFTGPGDPRPVESAPIEAGASPEPNVIDRGSRNDILIYVDYLCPHCGEFEHASGHLLEAALEAGNTTVEIVPLSFLDRASQNTNYSSRAAGAISCLADSQPESAWAGHAALLSADAQANALSVDDAGLAAALDSAVGGLNGDARDCIEQARFAPFAQALNQWAFANPIPNTATPGQSLEGTPTIVVNGEFYTGSPHDSAAFQAFLEEQLN